MNITHLLNRPVVIDSYSASGELDELGGEVDTVVGIETVGELQPRTEREPNAHPDIADSDWVGFFLPGDAEYLSSASVVWAPGLGDFKVVGDAPTWRNPFDQTDSFIEVALNRVAGPGDSEGS